MELEYLKSLSWVLDPGVEGQDSGDLPFLSSVVCNLGVPHNLLRNFAPTQISGSFEPCCIVIAGITCVKNCPRQDLVIPMIFPSSDNFRLLIEELLQLALYRVFTFLHIHLIYLHIFSLF